MEELIEKINILLKEFNNSFTIEASIIEENGEKIANGLKITKLNNNGSEFVNLLFDMFNQIISNSDKYELAYDKDKGIIIAEKVVTYISKK